MHHVHLLPSIPFHTLLLCFVVHTQLSVKFCPVLEHIPRYSTLFVCVTKHVINALKTYTVTEKSVVVRDFEHSSFLDPPSLQISCHFRGYNDP